MNSQSDNIDFNIFILQIELDVMNIVTLHLIQNNDLLWEKLWRNRKELSFYS